MHIGNTGQRLLAIGYYFVELLSFSYDMGAIFVELLSFCYHLGRVLFVSVISVLRGCVTLGGSRGSHLVHGSHDVVTTAFWGRGNLDPFPRMRARSPKTHAS